MVASSAESRVTHLLIRTSRNGIELGAGSVVVAGAVAGIAALLQRSISWRSRRCEAGSHPSRAFHWMGRRNGSLLSRVLLRVASCCGRCWGSCCGCCIALCRAGWGWGRNATGCGWSRIELRERYRLLRRVLLGALLRALSRTPSPVLLRMNMRYACRSVRYVYQTRVHDELFHCLFDDRFPSHLYICIICISCLPTRSLTILDSPMNGSLFLAAVAWFESIARKMRWAHLHLVCVSISFFLFDMVGTLLSTSVGFGLIIWKMKNRMLNVASHLHIDFLSLIPALRAEKFAI